MHFSKSESLTLEGSQKDLKGGLKGNLRIWLLAARPRTLAAAFAPVLIGSSMAAANQSFHFPSALAALIAALFIQIGTNFANDYFDFKKGADSQGRIGPVRVTQSGLIPPRNVLRASLVMFGLALAIGVYLSWRGGWPIVITGVVSILAGILYTGGPFALAYVGLGDLFVLIFFGPVAVAGTYYVQALQAPLEVIIAGFAPGLLSAAILAVNNTRDIEGDRRVGKKTLPARFGRTFGRVQYVLAVVLAALIPVFLYLSYRPHIYSLVATLISIPAFGAFKTIFTSTDGPTLNRLLARTAQLLFLYSALFSVGWMIHP